jgi:hypothetical protein
VAICVDNFDICVKRANKREYQSLVIMCGELGRISEMGEKLSGSAIIRRKVWTKYEQVFRPGYASDRDLESL